MSSPLAHIPHLPSSTALGVFEFATCSEYVGISYGSIIRLGARGDQFIDKTPCLNRVSASLLQSLPSYGLSRRAKSMSQMPRNAPLVACRDRIAMTERRGHSGCRLTMHTLLYSSRPRPHVECAFFVFFAISNVSQVSLLSYLLRDVPCSSSSFNTISEISQTTTYFL